VRAFPWRRDARDRPLGWGALSLSRRSLSRRARRSTRTEATRTTTPSPLLAATAPSRHDSRRAGWWARRPPLARAQVSRCTLFEYRTFSASSGSPRTTSCSAAASSAGWTITISRRTSTLSPTSGAADRRPTRTGTTCARCRAPFAWRATASTTSSSAPPRQLRPASPPSRGSSGAFLQPARTRTHRTSSPSSRATRRTTRASCATSQAAAPPGGARLGAHPAPRRAPRRTCAAGRSGRGRACPSSRRRQLRRRAAGAASASASPRASTPRRTWRTAPRPPAGAGRWAGRGRPSPRSSPSNLAARRPPSLPPLPASPLSHQSLRASHSGLDSGPSSGPSGGRRSLPRSTLKSTPRCDSPAISPAD
ncbi:hypothetical protein EMIHUDRAFT_445842, partial [Emiliania huxleyi CCMP1516]|uniref:Uncharacterized protein n=2 Tax=Emiliania huxleyi TaxID=2903 RepID=A0A0D3IQ85_EMIH1